MDIIVIGVYNELDTIPIEEKLISNGMKVIWRLNEYIYEGNKGFYDLKEHFNLCKIGVVIDIDNENDIVAGSSPLIDSISDFYMAYEWDNEITSSPKFFQFLEELKNINIKEMILAIGDHWTDETTVILDDINFNQIKSRLYSLYVWCPEVIDLKTNSSDRDDYHPLVLKINSGK